MRSTPLALVVAACAAVGAACATPPPAPAAPTAPAPPSPPIVVERELPTAVAAGGDDPAAALGCTLAAPRGAARVPAVILLKGTGASPRDYNDGPADHDLMRVLATRLAEAGVASLRCDTRGTGASTGGPFAAGTLATYARDARAMLAALRRAPEVDPARLGIVGHSEGGIVARLVIGEEPGVRAAVFLASGASDFREAVIAGRVDRARRAGATAEQIELIHDVQAVVLDAVAAGTPLPDGIPPKLRAQIAELTPWLRSRLASDTRAIARAMRALPLLILQGGGDWVVPAEDAAILRDDLAAGHNPDATVIVYPGLNHHFARAPGDQLPGAVIEPKPIADAAAFLRAHL